MRLSSGSQFRLNDEADAENDKTDELGRRAPGGRSLLSPPSLSFVPAPQSPLLLHLLLLLLLALLPLLPAQTSIGCEPAQAARAPRAAAVQAEPRQAAAAIGGQGATKKTATTSESGQQSNNNECAPPTTLALGQGGRSGGGGLQRQPEPSGCNPISEFYCPLDDRCVPIEWRCDFSRQCSDGRDELGCAPLACRFQLNTCNWRSDGGGGGGGGDDKEQQRRRADVAWRRYLGPVWNVSMEVDEMDESLVDLNEANELQSGERFLFAPLKLGEQPGAVRASLRAPPVGQTASMCQLRFEYAIWLTGRADLAAPDAQSGRATLSLRAQAASGGRSTVGRPPGGQLEQSGGRPLVWQAEATFGATPQTTTTTTRATGGRHNGSGANLSPAPRANWMIGVAQLGHLRNSELVFEATLTSGAGVWNELDDDKSAAAGRHLLGALVALRRLRFHQCAWPLGAPLELELEAAAAAGQSASKLSKGEGVQLDQEEQNEQTRSWVKALGQLRTSNGSLASCASQQFACANGICLAPERLCNFVDDCMTSGRSGGFGAPADWRPMRQAEDEQLYLCEPIWGRENFERRSSVADFAPTNSGATWTLEGNLLGLGRAKIERNLEQVVGLPRVDHSTATRSGAFLSLDLRPPPPPSNCSSAKRVLWLSINSQWLISEPESQPNNECRLKFFYNLVSSEPVRQANRRPSQHVQLPFELQLQLEHFSLNKSSNEAPTRLRPRELDSKLLLVERKLDALISSGAKLKSSSCEQEKEAAEGEPKRQVAEGGKRAAIEYAGADFWREANYKVVGLKPGDLFYLRLLIRAEYSSPLGGQAGRAPSSPSYTMNIDDLATHFGCLQASEPQLFRLGVRGSPLTSYRSFRMDDFRPRAADGPAAALPARALARVAAPPPAPTTFKRNKWHRVQLEEDYDADNDDDDDDDSVQGGGHQQPPSATQRHHANRPKSDAPAKGHGQRSRRASEEPAKLAACVLAVFSLIISLIALIVFVLVPRVERAMMSNREQIELGVSAEVSDAPISSASGVLGGGGGGGASGTSMAWLGHAGGAAPSSAAYHLNQMDEEPRRWRRRRNHRLMLDCSTALDEQLAENDHHQVWLEGARTTSGSFGKRAGAAAPLGLDQGPSGAQLFSAGRDYARAAATNQQRPRRPRSLDIARRPNEVGLRSSLLLASSSFSSTSPPPPPLVPQRNESSSSLGSSWPASCEQVPGARHSQFAPPRRYNAARQSSAHLQQDENGAPVRQEIAGQAEPFGAGPKEEEEQQKELQLRRRRRRLLRRRKHQRSIFKALSTASDAAAAAPQATGAERAPRRLAVRCHTGSAGRKLVQKRRQQRQRCELAELGQAQPEAKLSSSSSSFSSLSTSGGRQQNLIEFYHERLVASDAATARQHHTGDLASRHPDAHEPARHDAYLDANLSSESDGIVAAAAADGRCRR